MFKNWSIQSRLWILVIVWFGVALLVGGVGLMQMSRVGDRLEEVTGTLIPLTEAITWVETGQLEQSLHFERGLRHVSQGQEAEFNTDMEEFVRNGQEVIQHLDRAESIIRQGLGSEAHLAFGAHLASMLDQIAEIRSRHVEFSRRGKRVMGRARDGVGSDLESAETEALGSLLAKLDLRLEKLLIQVEGELATYSDQAKTMESQGYWRTVVFLLVGLALAIWLARVLGRGIIEPLRRASALAGRIGQGDLEEREPSRQPVGDNEIEGLLEAMREMAASLRRMRRGFETKTRELERSNADLQQFAYVASHDLQEPLRTLASFAQLLARRYQDKLDQDANEFLEFITDGAARMQDLIDDLLTFSRVGTHGKPMEPVDLNDAVEKARGNLARTLTECDARVLVEDLPVVPGDRHQMILLFQNLIGNAVKFRTNAPPEVRVSAERLGDAWRISVIDNGIGIEPQFFERIFEIFQRLHAKERYPGTGIGLAVCKRIVQRHNGAISVESEPGRGTVFHVDLPIKRRGGDG